MLVRRGARVTPARGGNVRRTKGVPAPFAETPAKLRHSGESRNPEGAGKRGLAGFPLGARSTNGFCRGFPWEGGRETLAHRAQGFPAGLFELGWQGLGRILRMLGETNAKPSPLMSKGELKGV